MTAKSKTLDGQPVSLQDKWTADQGVVVMNGTQAIARVLLAQATLDRRRGISSAGYISGYRGSPLGSVDTTLWSIARRLESANILFQPGVNEDIAATAIRGTQQLNSVPSARYDGVFAAWYGKGPGVDRSGDAFKHGNYAGTHPQGGVLIFYGDDHAGKSSTVAHQSEQAVAASLIPSLYPADVQDVLSYGLLGFALSRYSGSWVGIKCVNEVAEQTATVELDLDHFQPILPPLLPDVPKEIHIQQASYNPLREEQIVVEHRLPLVHAFVRANRLDGIMIRAETPALGLITAGKSYGDVRAALALLGLDEAEAGAVGISLYKVGCIWPLEPIGIRDFATGQAVLFVVEEKKSFLEQQVAATLINQAHRPWVIGKLDEEGAPLLSSVMPLEPMDIAFAIAARLERLGRLDERMRAQLEALASTSVAANAIAVRRLPFFCSGCPHSRSTRVPEGSLSMTGIGCHTMVALVRPQQALLPTQMGGEGGNWIGLAPFTNTKHIFQNMGDGTYYHSGLLAIRAAVAARVNITYKILYNDAVAMTGGQPVDGPISVATIACQVRNEGVARIVVLSDDPSRHQGNPELPVGVTIGHRDELDAVQQELRDTPGCTVLIYEQTCAAEKRRRRKRGSYPNPPKRLFIAREVCEGVGTARYNRPASVWSPWKLHWVASGRSTNPVATRTTVA
uniref:indolepyruvate ferredoxin oxidoreductase family protein n=1 Tax=Rhodanobacter glycinis TaxID=582702 RepID=UPI001C0F23FE|nr:indolepyruvate ferredoxin oxidoreductase family protein [Rhodanobacter glycinis]